MSIEVVSTSDKKEAVAAPKGDAAQSKATETNVSAAAASEQAEQTEAGQSEVDESEGSANADAGEQGDESTIKGDEKGKKKGGFKKRIDKLTSKLSAAAQETEYWKQQALKGKQPDAPVVESVTKKADVNGKPKSDDFTTHDEYVEALTDWRLDQKDKEKETKAKESKAQADYQTQVSTLIEKIDAFKAKHDDWDDLMDEVEHIPISSTLKELIASSENGPELMYELAKNPKDYERIVRLSPTAAAREVGKYEARLAKDSTAETEVRKTKTNAPPPLTPVGSNSSGSSGVTKDLDKMDTDEFIAYRKEQIKKNRG